MTAFIFDLAVGLLITGLVLGLLDARKTRGYGVRRGRKEDES